MTQGDIWWAELPAPAGSTAGFRRPVIVVQSDSFNRSQIGTIVCVPLTSQLRWADAAGNIRLTPRQTALPKESVAQATLILAVDRRRLTERVGRLSGPTLALVLAGVDLVLGRTRG
jgi:mRNA interferase MazF